MTEVKEVLRAWLAGLGKRPAAARAGVNVKTAARYIRAAQVAGLDRGGGEGQLTDELIGVVVGVVRPARPAGHGSSWELLERSGTAAPYLAGVLRRGRPFLKLGLRLPGHDRRRGPAAEAARAGAHRGGVAVLVRVPDVLPDGTHKVLRGSRCVGNFVAGRRAERTHCPRGDDGQDPFDHGPVCQLTSVVIEYISDRLRERPCEGRVQRAAA